MTQLIIAGVETVLPQNFSVTVKRENSFFTKSGEYTYDCTLRLDNPVNQQLYGFLNRLNKSDQIETNRTAMLMADGHVYCRGTEVITKWTDQTVSIQIVSGESELNFFIGQDQKIEELDLGRVGNIATRWIETQSPVYMNSDYCLPTIRSANGHYFNTWLTDTEPEHEGDLNYHDVVLLGNPMPQPYLCPFIERILEALGYNHTNDHYEPVNHLRDTPFNKLFIVNTSSVSEYAKMLPGWTVKDFLTEVERLTGIVFVTDNSDPENLKCDILMKTIFYQDARQLPLQDVIDAYEMKVDSEDSREAEFTASDVSYELPDHRWANLMKLPEGILESAETLEFDDMAELLETAAEHDYNETTILLDTTTGRRYINCMRYPDHVIDSEDLRAKYLMEVNSFRNLDREDNTSTLELKITPAPMAMLRPGRVEIIDLGSEDGFMMPNVGNETQSDSEQKTFEDSIRDYKEEKPETTDLYCAFCSTTAPLGTFKDGVVEPVAYTDFYHIQLQPRLFFPTRYYQAFSGEINVPTASLRLQDLDADYYQGGYEIDTRHAVTFQTFDPNHIDVRQVYVIQNRRYVVRDVEETITAEGRQPLWRLTCYPIHITDEAIEHRWVLTRGVWDDGAAWLDDGRWNDNPI